jgi:hypothetical protein
MRSGTVLEAAVGVGILQRMHAYLTPDKPEPRPKRLALLLRMLLRLLWRLLLRLLWRLLLRLEG